MPVVTMLYAGLLGLMAVAVAVPAGRLRGQTGVSIGDGGNAELLLAIRRHGNFAEWVPLALILIGPAGAQRGLDHGDPRHGDCARRRARRACIRDQR